MSVVRLSNPRRVSSSSVVSAAGTYGVHSDALDWYSRATSVGGVISTSTLFAVSQFCVSINAATGLRAAILRLNLFCGSNLTACLVPLYRGASLGGTQLGGAIDTNVNFVSGDYQETGANAGLKANGTNKYLNTGFSTSLLSSHTSTHLSVSGNSFAASGGSNFTFLGSDVGTASQVFSLDENLNYLGDVRAFRSGSGYPLGNVASTTLSANEAHLIGTRTSSTDSRIYRSGPSVVLNTTNLTPASSTVEIFVCAINGSGSPTSISAGRYRMYSIGNGLSSAQAVAFSNAVAAFNSAMGRT